jgi:hypothetical protein
MPNASLCLIAYYGASLGEFLFAAFVCWMFFAFLTYAAGQPRGMHEGALVAGLLLGPLGLLAVVCLDLREMCPVCYTRLNGPAQVCPGCRGILTRDEKDKIFCSHQKQLQAQKPAPAQPPLR